MSTGTSTALLVIEPLPEDDLEFDASVGSPVVSRPTVSVVIPTLNEAENLPYVLGRLPAWISQVIIADGHSTDDTVAVALRHRPDATIVLQDGKGKGNALACAFRRTTGDITVMLDADGSTDPRRSPGSLLL